MAEKKKQTIVIKKVTVVAGGGHGGSWKVALADFMTALMAFFLVMWLLGQSEETKKLFPIISRHVCDYRTNQVYEITLEKLFLDILNETSESVSEVLWSPWTNPESFRYGSASLWPRIWRIPNGERFCQERSCDTGRL